MRTFKDLKVWQLAKTLSVECYKLTTEIVIIQPTEKFGLAQQIQRASVSIPSNIAEGAGRESVKDYQNFLSIAYGSLNELETQVELSKEIYPPITARAERILKDINQLRGLLFRFKKSLSAPRPKGAPSPKPRP